jgi:hypothetical protein
MEAVLTTTISWETYPSSILVKASDGSSSVFSVGDFVWFEGRDEAEPGVLLTMIVGDETPGPKGVTYLPWRYKEQRWATPHISWNGDNRFLICFPHGMIHRGVHIDWSTMKKVDTIDHPLFKEKVDKVIANAATHR